MDEVKALRDVRSSHIGKLISISGTVTRTTDVKPELLYGTFTCDVCGTVIEILTNSSSSQNQLVVAIVNVQIEPNSVLILVIPDLRIGNE